MAVITIVTLPWRGCFARYVGHQHNADIWHLFFHREKYLKCIWKQVDNSEYRLLPPQLIRTGKQDDIVLWSAADVMVMKWVTLEIKDLLPLQSRCVHTAGHHGGRDSLTEITQMLAQGVRFVWWTDIRGYYRHIRKEQRWHHICRFVRSPVLQNIIKQYIWYTVEHGGEFFTPQGGICRGSALSPLLGHRSCGMWIRHSAVRRGFIMSGTWTIFFFCPRGAGHYVVLSDGCMIILRTLVLNAIRTKHMSVVLSAGLIGWACGLMQRAPPG